MFDNVPTALPYIKDGKIRPLAVTVTAPVDVLPDLPLVADYLPGYEASAWYGIVGPKGTPAEVVDKLNREANAILAEGDKKKRLAELGASLLPGTPADFAKLLADETAKWGKVIRFAGIKAEQ